MPWSLRRRIPLVLAFLAATGLAAPVSAQWREPANCSVASQNLFVRDVLTDLYYWNTRLAPLNPVAFGSPDAYLDAVKFRELDQTFSYVGYRAASDAFYSASQYIGSASATITRRPKAVHSALLSLGPSSSSSGR